jgi:ribosomal protein L19
VKKLFKPSNAYIIAEEARRMAENPKEPIGEAVARNVNTHSENTARLSDFKGKILKKAMGLVRRSALIRLLSLSRL